MKKILIAGASGFIGHALIDKLLEENDFEIVGLSRNEKTSHHPRLIWKKCDLFSLKDITDVMEGCDSAYYLVHSMLPSASLSQGAFYDFDLIMADNFVRASLKHELKHIIYLGGMIPVVDDLSWHLKSRLEVEETFRKSRIKTSVLRAGLIIGPHGSSFTILERLIRRLPIMICPAWTKTLSQPVALQDIIKALTRTLNDESIQGKIYDMGGPEIITYQGLIQKAGQQIKKSSTMLTLNIIPLSLSRFWVSLVTGVPKKLVYPLVLSLRYQMLASADRAWPHPEDLLTPLDDALRLSLQGDEKQGFKGHVPREKDVRSIQRLVLPPERNAEWVANEYFNWLPNFFSTLVKVLIVDNRCTFYLFDPSIKLLILEKSSERSSPDRQLLYIIGGMLSAKQERGRLEFREVLDRKYVMAAIHEFRPALPWFIYKWSQAIIHLIVMKAFGEHLKWHVISNQKVIV
jgi:uncharacterized protein YbjT (DUF2867 family)